MTLKPFDPPPPKESAFNRFRAMWLWDMVWGPYAKGCAGANWNYFRLQYQLLPEDLRKYAQENARV